MLQTLTSDRLQSCISQLLPTKRRVDSVRLNVLGFSGVGKSSLIEALHCGYLTSLLRRSGATALLSAVVTRPCYRGSRTPEHRTTTGTLDSSPLILMIHVNTMNTMNLWQGGGLTQCSTSSPVSTWVGLQVSKPSRYVSKQEQLCPKQLESLRRHCTITRVGNVKQVSFKPGPVDCYGRCGSDRIWQTVPDTCSGDRESSVTDGKESDAADNQ